MQKSKLFDICRAIEKAEWRPLLEFASSPYFNKDADVERMGQCLYDIFCSCVQPMPADTRSLWAQVFPKKAWDAKACSYIMSNTVQLIEKFLGQRQMENAPLDVQLYQLEAFAYRKLDKSYSRRHKETKAQWEASPYRDASWHYAGIWLAEVEDLHFNLQNIRTANPILAILDKQYDQYYRIVKTRLHCNLLNQSRTLNLPTPALSWPSNPLEERDTNPQQSVYDLYRSLQALLQTADASLPLLGDFRKALRLIQSQIPKDDLISLYYMAINYCLIAINKGHREFAGQLLELYEEGLLTGHLLVNGELSPWMYKNIVKLGLGLQRFDWTEQFILQYTDHLPHHQRQDAFCFNMADLRYHQHHHDEALQFLNQVEFSDASYKHGAKIMLLKIYYELGETEAFASLVASYRLMLLREKALPEDIRAAYQQFVRLILKLFKIRPHDQLALEKLRTEIERTKRLNDRSWLMSRVSDR
ncbi:MAG: hypothetical protein R2795_12235 [Saprospiraceae bacterium]